MLKKGFLLLVGCTFFLQPASSQPICGSRVEQAGSFPVFDHSIATPIVLDPADHKVVTLAAAALQSDVEALTGIRPGVVNYAGFDGARAILVGTIGKSKLIDTLIASGKVSAETISGQWEAYSIQLIRNVSADVQEALVIVGSDPRGTAYGIFELSRMLGVSPWIWWADVQPTPTGHLFVLPGEAIASSPSVKYRGIFLNDEGWGLEPWASKTYEPEVGNIGPKTYGRIFELMLRLRANTIWPAMHPGTLPFHQVPGNAACADDYAIVVGSSHCEPMLRNNVREWEKPKDHFNYLTHGKEVLSYWEERVKERTAGESLFTIGMRGVHDGAIQGPRNQQERIKTLESIFADQRKLLARYLGNGDPSRVAQIFVPYKEVLDDYQAGLRVPEGVTLVWPDDNFGYVRRYGTPGERERSGGLGVYYHLSYLGNPLSWLWIDTQSAALIWSEMTRAYEQGARTFWIANVGDLKNTERSAEFFLDLAWNADHADLNAPARFMHEAAARDFGPEYADRIVDILQRLQIINVERKAEHLQWHYSLTRYKPTELNEAEIHNRLTACAELLKDSEALANQLPSEKRDAYFELIGYAVGITEAANERYFRSELARAAVARGRSADADRAAAEAAEGRVGRLTARYNHETAEGKWKHIVTANGVAARDWRRFQPDPAAERPAPGEGNVCPPAPPEVEPLPHPDGARAGDFVERGKVISIEAGHFSNKTDLDSGAGWCSVPGLGRTGSAVTVLPSSAAIPTANAPSLEYRFHVSTGGAASIHVRLLPTHPLVLGQGLRFAVELDDGKRIPFSAISGFDSKSDEWKINVMASARTVSGQLPGGLKPGWHTLRLVAVDAGVVVDKIVVDLGGLAPSYDGPAETRIP